MDTSGENRLTPEEQELLSAIRRWFRYRTPQNLRHVARAAAQWIRRDNATTKEATAP